MGDDFFSGTFPFVDLENGGDVEGLIRNVKAVLDELPPDAKIIPGHGPVSTLIDLKSYHRMLVETTGIVRRRMADGQTLEQIQAEGLPDEWGVWGTGFIKTERWLEIVYQSLSKADAPE
jgi:glyoxylase-like metal-dependent hydrolase (beta-lactamase superfamily II)